MERSELREDPRLFLESLLTREGVRCACKEVEKLSDEEVEKRIKELFKH